MSEVLLQRAAGGEPRQVAPPSLLGIQSRLGTEFPSYPHTEQVPVSDYVGSSKNLKNLKGKARLGTVDRPASDRLREGPQDGWTGPPQMEDGPASDRLREGARDAGVLERSLEEAGWVQGCRD